MKIAILVCDTPARNLVLKYGDYSSLFETLLKNVKKNIDCISFDVINQIYPRPSEWDVIVVTGSRHSSYDNIEWITKLKEFLRDTILCKNEKLKIFGICFGHQIIAEAMGGQVSKNPKGWEIGYQELRVNDAGQKLLSGLSTLMHQDIVTTAPQGFEIFASSDICANHGMVYQNRVFTIQGHPEFNADFVCDLIATRSGAAFSKEFADNAIQKTLNCKLHDGVLLIMKLFKM